MVLIKAIDNGFVVESETDRSRIRYFEHLDDALACAKELLTSEPVSESSQVSV